MNMRMITLLACAVLAQGCGLQENRQTTIPKTEATSSDEMAKAKDHLSKLGRLVNEVIAMQKDRENINLQYYSDARLFRKYKLLLDEEARTLNKIEKLVIDYNKNDKYYNGGEIPALSVVKEYRLRRAYGLEKFNEIVYIRNRTQSTMVR